MNLHSLIIAFLECKHLSIINALTLARHACVTEKVCQGINYALRHAQACTTNCVLLAITQAYKCSWQLKPQFSHYFAGGSVGLSRSKDFLFEDTYNGAEDRAQLQGHIVEPLIRNTVDAFNNGRKYYLLIYIGQ